MEFAKKLVPTIEANNDGRTGVIIHDVKLEDVKDGDMIICRNNAPLIKIYNELLKLGKKCFIRGKDIGNNLKNVVKSTRKKKLSIDLKRDGVFPALYNDLFTQRDIIMNRFGIDEKNAMETQQMQNLLDIINALEVLSEGLTTSDELVERIDAIFPKKDKKKGIALSTIHKAKGLEADNVYVACKSLMPSKSAKKDWEINQEYNLMYVAYTRAKNTLGFICEEGFEKFSMNDNTRNSLKRIEAMVNLLYGNKTHIKNLSDAMTVFSRMKPIEVPTKKNNMVIGLTNNKINKFSEMLKKRKK